MYYALYDIEEKDYLYSGYNCTSRKEVKEQLWDLLEPEREEIYLTNNINKVSLRLLLEVNLLVLEKSKTPFPERDYC